MHHIPTRPGLAPRIADFLRSLVVRVQLAFARYELRYHEQRLLDLEAQMADSRKVLHWRRDDIDDKRIELMRLGG